MSIEAAGTNHSPVVGAVVVETPRLVLRRFTPEDAAFLLGLLNEPSFIANIGDRGLRTIEDARRFIVEVPMASYDKHGHGHFRVELKETGAVIGTCGLIRRDYIGETDVGFAYLPAHWGKGYAYEAAVAVMEFGRTTLGLQRIVAVVSPHNTASIRVLEKLGLRYSGPTQLAADAETVHLYV
ncbi:GNAT family N-acetyltransferase [Povalibacter sp.]|uniref:GNAT family N-acetyltransferase n=1 Tax=Povalibacter sp. TaxID=1962978 RepID=UPI002F405FBA